MLWLMHFVMIANAQDKIIINDPNVENREVGNFHGVKVSGSVTLFISQDSETKVLISAREAEDREKIVTEVRHGILHIYYKPEREGVQFNFGRNRMLRTYVSAPVLESLESSGSGSLVINGSLKSDKLELSHSGSGRISGAVEVKELDYDQSGSGSAELKGSAKKANLTTSGSGNIRSYGLSTDICEVSTSGSGSVEVTVNKELSASTSGSGSVRFKGAGLIRDISTSGSGKVKRVNQ